MKKTVEIYNTNERKYEKAEVNLPKRWADSVHRAVNYGINGEEMLKLLAVLGLPVLNSDEDAVNFYGSLKQYRRYTLKLYADMWGFSLQVERK